MMNSTQDVDIIFSPTLADDTDPLQRPVNIGWTVVQNPFGWVANTYWNGVIKRASYNKPWTWESFDFDKILIDGIVVGGKVTAECSKSVYIDYIKIHAIASVSVQIKYEVGCGGSPLTYTQNYSKLNSFTAGNY